MQNQGMGMGQQPRTQAGHQNQQQPQQQQRYDTSWTRSGQDARANSAAEADRAAARREERQKDMKWPNRFFLKATPGQTGQDHSGRIVILDNQPGPAYYEHMMPDHRGYKIIPVPCAKEFDNCPLCPANGGESESSYVFLLTVLNLSGYFNREKGIHVHPTRELMVVKQGQHDMFYRLMDQNGGNLRGLEILMIRDGQRSPKIGQPDPIAQIVRRSDEEIQQYLAQHNKLGPDTYTNQQGQVIEKYPAGHMMMPFDYATFLERPNVEQMRQRWGGAPPIGANDPNDAGQWGPQNPGMAQPPQGFNGGGGAPPQGGMGMGGNPGTSAPPAYQGGYVDQSTSAGDPNAGQPQTMMGNDGSMGAQNGAPAPETTTAASQEGTGVRQRTAPQTQNPDMGATQQTQPQQGMGMGGGQPQNMGAQPNQPGQGGMAPATDLDDEIPF